METAGDHEVDDQPEVALDADGNALANAAEGSDGFAFDDGWWWIDGAKDKDALQAEMPERAAEDAGL